MELKGKDRRILRGLGNGLKPVLQVGRGGVTTAVLRAVDQAHRGSELLKVKVLDTCEDDRKEVARQLQDRSESEVVQVLGRTLLLYRRDPDDPRIDLPSLATSAAEAGPERQGDGR